MKKVLIRRAISLFNWFLKDRVISCPFCSFPLILRWNADDSYQCYNPLCRTPYAWSFPEDELDEVFDLADILGIVEFNIKPLFQKVETHFLRKENWEMGLVFVRAH